MQTIENSFQAAGAWRYNSPGRYFRLLKTQVPVTVRFYGDTGGVVAEATQVEGGYYAMPAGGFGGFEIVSPGAQLVKVAVSDGTGGYDRTVGDVAITNLQGPMVQTQKTVTNAAGQLLAQNNARRYLMIQNKDASGSVFLTFGAGPATVAGGLKLAPNGAIVFDATYCPTNAVQAIGDTANNQNVIVLEG